MAKKVVASMKGKSKRFVRVIKFNKNEKGFYATSEEMVDPDLLNKNL